MEDIGLFCGPLIPLFWTSDDVGPEFQSQRGYPHLHALLPVCNGILRFTSGVTPADLLAASHENQIISNTSKSLTSPDFNEKQFYFYYFFLLKFVHICLVCCALFTITLLIMYLEKLFPREESCQLR